MPSNIFWKGGATAVAQVDTYTPATVTTADVNTLTVKDENGATVATITFTVGGTATSAAVVTGLTSAWNANSITAAMATLSGTSTLILTAATAGVAFYVTSSVTGTGSLTRAATTANAGPNDWNTASNWSTVAVPVNSDNVTLDARGASNPITVGLNQSAVTLASLTYLSNGPLTGQAILSLNISATVVNGPPLPAGSQSTTARFNLNTGTNQTLVNIQASSSFSADAGLEAVRINGAHASNSLIVSGASIVGIGTNRPSDAPNFPTMVVGAAGTSGTPTVNIGPGHVAGITCTSIGGTINANHRPAGNAFTSLVLAGIPGATPPLVDCSNNASALTIASLTLGSGKIKVASASQLTVTATVQSFGSARTFVSSYV